MIERFRRLRNGLSRGEAPVTEAREEESSGTQADPASLIWIFGSGRSGSTWLARTWTGMPGYALWFEPKITNLFGDLYKKTTEEKKQRGHFILSGETWLTSAREFILSESLRFTQVQRRFLNRFLVIKDPGGSAGVPIISEALPESRFVLLVRDPRDVVPSAMDAWREGSWGHRPERDSKGPQPEPEELESFENQARGYADSYRRIVAAYDAHRGPKTTISYEELRSNTLAAMERILNDLDLPYDPETLAASVERRSWENVPEKEKGVGKFFRKGKAGGWREDLTTEQVATIENATADLMQRFGYTRATQNATKPETRSEKKAEAKPGEFPTETSAETPKES